MNILFVFFIAISLFLTNKYSYFFIKNIFSQNQFIGKSKYIKKKPIIEVNFQLLAKCNHRREIQVIVSPPLIIALHY